MSVNGAVTGVVDLAQAGISIGVVSGVYGSLIKPIRKKSKKVKNIWK